MRKIFFITLFFLFSKLLDAQCDSLSFNNDVKELYKFGLENINKKNVSNDKLYYENFYQLFKKTDELGLKYKNSKFSIIPFPIIVFLRIPLLRI